MDRLIALVLLRWRSELRALAGARERAAGLVLLTPLLLLASLVGSVLVYVGARALEAARPELVLPVLSVAATAIGVFWALSPLLAGVAFSETHDVSRLLHFPVPLTVLVISSLVANLAQPMVLLRLPLLLALALALAGGWLRLPFALLGVLLSFAFMLAADQVIGLLLHGLSRNRRWHDVALFVGLGLGFLLSVAPILLLAGGGGRVLAGALDLITRQDLFAASPFAWGVRAAVHAGRGDGLACLVFSALAGLALAVAVGSAAALIHRIHRGELDVGPAASRSGATARMVLPGEVGALVEKDLRSAWRDPSLKATLLIGLLGPVFFLFLLSRSPGAGSPGASILLLATIVGLTGFGANAFGLERRGIALLLGFPLPRWKILLGKNLCAIVLRSPGVAVLLLAGLLVAPLALLPAAAAIAAATLLVASGLDNYASILFPMAVPPAGRNPYGGGSAGGRGLGAAVLSALLLFATLLVSAPFAFLAWLPLLLNSPALWLISLPLAVAGAASVYAMLVAGAAGLLSRREADVLQRILVEE